MYCRVTLSIAWPMPSCGVCLSVRLFVCLSVTFVYCIETSKRTLKLFSSFGRFTILVFFAKRYGNIRTGTPLTGGGLNVDGVYEIIVIFDQYLTLSPKR